jgi:hypothetical protein
MFNLRIKRKLPLFFLIILISMFFVFPVYAQSFDITQVPQYLDNQIGCGEFGGGVLATLILALIFLIPTSIISSVVVRKGSKTGFVPEFIVAILIVCFSVAIGWLSYWILLVMCLGIGLLFAIGAKDILTG